MFNNIGKKIKTLSVVICVLMILISLGGAGFLIFLGFDEDEIFFLFGIAALIVGPLLAWITSFFAYGFGELIDKTSSIDSKVGSGSASYNQYMR